MSCIPGLIFFSAGCSSAVQLSTTQTALMKNEQSPFADIHLHFNWDQEEIIDPHEIVQRLKNEYIVLGVVSSVPSENALKLKNAGAPWIVALFSPYITPLHRHSWHLDQNIIEKAREGLNSGKFAGIGELHLWSGLPPGRDNKILLALFELAKQFDVPFLLHTESSDERFIIPVCQRHSGVRILWAHAGGIMKPASVENVLNKCPNIWVELSARDPWRYNSLVDESGALPESWRNLFIKYPTRFMTGSDPVWNVTKTQRWDEPDEGWDHLHELITFHRQWLSNLPSEVEKRIRLTNAIEFFKVQIQPSP